MTSFSWKTTLSWSLMLSWSLVFLMGAGVRAAAFAQEVEHILGDHSQDILCALLPCTEEGVLRSLQVSLLNQPIELLPADLRSEIEDPDGRLFAIVNQVPEVSRLSLPSGSWLADAYSFVLSNAEVVPSKIPKEESTLIAYYESILFKMKKGSLVSPIELSDRQQLYWSYAETVAKARDNVLDLLRSGASPFDVQLAEREIGMIEDAWRDKADRYRIEMIVERYSDLINNRPESEWLNAWRTFNIRESEERVAGMPQALADSAATDWRTRIAWVPLCIACDATGLLGFSANIGALWLNRDWLSPQILTRTALAWASRSLGANDRISDGLCLLSKDTPKRRLILPWYVRGILLIKDVAFNGQQSNLHKDGAVIGTINECSRFNPIKPHN